MHENGKSAPPAWMKNISQGEWQQISKAQLRSKQRPCYPLKTRVWATLILHSDGYQSETAVRLHKNERVAFTTSDISAELQKAATKYYTEAKIKVGPDLSSSREKVRRALVDFEADGLIERQADHGIRVLLNPKTPTPAHARKQWREAKASEEQMQFQFSQVFRAFHLPLPKKSQASNPYYQKTVERAFKAAKAQFIAVLEESKEDNTEDLTEPSPSIAPLHVGSLDPPAHGVPHPPVRGVLYKEEKKVKKKEAYHPPASATTTNRLRLPLTLQELRTKDPAVTENFVERLYTAVCEGPGFLITNIHKITDKVLAALCTESFRTGPKNHGIGLLLTRVPAIALTWSQDNEQIRPDQRRSA